MLTRVNLLNISMLVSLVNVSMLADWHLAQSTAVDQGTSRLQIL